MILKKLNILFGILVMPLLGCREVHYYGYKPVELVVLGGDLGIDLRGRYGENYQKDGQDLLDWTFPYFLQFTYVVPADTELYGLEIKNIKLFGEETRNSADLDSIQDTNSRVYDRGKLIRMSAGPLTSDDFSYQNYILTATIVVSRTQGTPEEVEISVPLETDYRIERRSDSLDEATSI